MNTMTPDYRSLEFNFIHKVYTHLCMTVCINVQNNLQNFNLEYRLTVSYNRAYIQKTFAVGGSEKVSYL